MIVAAIGKAHTNTPFRGSGASSIKCGANAVGKLMRPRFLVLVGSGGGGGSEPPTLGL